MQSYGTSAFGLYVRKISEMALKVFGNANPEVPGTMQKAGHHHPKTQMGEEAT